MRVASIASFAAVGVVPAALLAVLVVVDSQAAWPTSLSGWAAPLSLSVTGLLLCATGAGFSARLGWYAVVRNPALSLGMGQLLLAVWFCLRSTAQHVTEALGGSLPSCGSSELLGVAALCMFMARRRLSATAWETSAPLLSLLLVGIAAIGLRELPRLVALSTDPDQHAFWAAQLLRIGAIPSQQGAWGPLDFQYPAGFALIARIWMLGGQINPVEAVTLQPLIQSYAAVNALAVWLAQQMATHRDRTDLRGWTQTSASVAGSLLAAVVFFAALPFSLTKPFLLLQKAGSISSLLLMVMVAALLAMFHGCNAIRARTSVTAALAAVLSYMALVNPVALLIPLVVSAVVVLALPGRLGRLTVRELLIGAIVFAAVLLCDPYYLNRFFLRGALPPPEIPPGFVDRQGEPLVEYVQYLRQHLIHLDWLRPWVMVPFVGHASIAISLILAAGWLRVRQSGAARSSALQSYMAIPMGCMVIGLALLPLFHLLRHKGDMFLLEPYLMQAIDRTAYLWFFGSVIFLALSLLMRLEAQTFLSRGGPFVILLLFIPLMLIRDRLPSELRVGARQAGCGPSSCDVKDDLELLAKVMPLLAPSGSVQPRVLVPNQRVDIWRERWLFPVGFARAMPSHFDIPLAFFYGKGDVSFNYRNYVDHVCEKFDREWLKARRVEFLFVPSDHAGACVSGLDALMTGPGVVARVGNAVFVRL